MFNQQRIANHVPVIIIIQHIQTQMSANFMCAKIFNRGDHDDDDDNVYKHSKFYVALCDTIIWYICPHWKYVR